MRGDIYRSNRICKKRSGKKRLFAAALTAIFAAAGLSGCAVTTLPIASESVTQETAAEVGGDKEKEIEDAVFVSGRADTMVETEKNLYFKYGNAIWRLEKEGNQLEKLLSFAENESNQAFWVAGKTLYYDVSKQRGLGAQPDFGLYGLDFTSMEKIRLADLLVSPSNLYVSNGYLYAQGFQTRETFKIGEDGTLTRYDAEAGTIYEKLPQGTRELYNVPLAYAVDHWGYMPLWDGENLFLAEKDGSNPRQVPPEKKGFGQLFYEDGFYTIGQENGSYTCKRYDRETLEESTVFETDSYPSLLQHRDGTLYYMEAGSSGLIGGDRFYYGVDAQGGTPEQLAVQAMEPGTMGNEFYSYYGNFYVTEDGFYCQKIRDYGVYLVKNDGEGKEIAAAVPAVFQSPIKELGRVEAETKAIPSADGQKSVAEYYVETLIFEGGTDAVNLMNQTIEDAVSAQVQAGESMAALVDEAWVQDENFKESTLTYLVAGVPYLDENYCCVAYNGYEYSGGAHGMPYRDYFLFDRQTGKRLSLSDILDTSEAELKTLVSARFRKMSEETGFSFQSPEDLERQVAEDISYQSPFYAAEEGLAFFYQPYEIAAYADGFPTVVVPYEELRLKIDLKRQAD